jgi:hypothetical protein
LRQADNTDSTFVGLARDRLTVADFLNLIRSDAVAGDMGDIPRVPDEAVDGEHRDIVTQCVTKSSYENNEGLGGSGGK